MKLIVETSPQAASYNLVYCQSCTCHFYDCQAIADYDNDALNDSGRVPFYIQQGAGLSLNIRPLSRVRNDSPCSYLEVGCGFGFGLDFALRTRGWQGLGIDPAPLAALGKESLSLPIELRYLSDFETPASHDVIAASEVIEHLPVPRAFIASLRSMLKPGGIVILTTPNGDALSPAMPPGLLLPMLSPSMHLVIQSKRSLEGVLRRVGFVHVDVHIDGHSLVAFASDAPLSLLDDDVELRRIYRDHLLSRAFAVEPGTDIFLGFAGRAFQECVNDSEMTQAGEVWSELKSACLARFNLDLDKLSSLPGGLASGLEEMAHLIPLNLSGLLYARGIHLLAAGSSRNSVVHYFLLAIESASALRRALAELGMEDGHAEDIAWTARAEALLCADDFDDLQLLSRVRAFPAAPTDGAVRREAVLQRLLTALVSSSRHSVAAALVRLTGLHQAQFAQGRSAPQTIPERDALYCLAVLGMELPEYRTEFGGYRMARDRFARVREHTQEDSPLWSAAMQGEEAARSRLIGLLGPTLRKSPLRDRLLIPYRTFCRALPKAGVAVLQARSASRAFMQWPEGTIQLGPKVCIYAHWDPDGEVRSYVFRQLRALAECGFSLLFVSNTGVLRTKATNDLQQICAAVITRQNSGHDFGAWQAGLARISPPLRDMTTLLLANDSVYGPTRPLAPLLDEFDFAKADFWGCTDSQERGYHLQSYFMAFSPTVVASKAWKRFWTGVRPVPTKSWVVQLYEVGLTAALMEAGFRCQAVWDLASIVEQLATTTSCLSKKQAKHVQQRISEGLAINPTRDLWRQLCEADFPFFKRDIVRNAPPGVKDIEEWRSVISAEQQVPIDDDLYQQTTGRRTRSAKDNRRYTVVD